jgi:hypothetical protein
MAGKLITRLVCAVAVTLLTFVGLATQSTAAPPARPPDDPDFSIDLPAGLACAGFDLRIEAWDAKNRVVKEFTDRNGNVVRLFAGNGALLALTNLDSGESLIMRTGGSVVHITVNPDNTETWVNTGHNVVVFFPPTSRPGRRRSSTWVNSSIPSTRSACSRWNVLPARRPISAPHCLTEVSDTIAIAAEEPVSSFV